MHSCFSQLRAPVALSLLAGACAASAQTVVAAAGSTTFAPVIVTATRFPEDAARLPFGISVITAADIREAGVTTVNEAIMKLLGVPGRLDLNGGGDYALDLRNFGSTSDNNQAVIVDGIKISEADLGGTRLAGIPIDSVDTIEVIRGSGAVLYGEGATAGAIVINTKAGKGVQRRSGAQVYGALGSHALLDTRGSATVVAGPLSLDLAGGHRETDNHRVNFHSETEGANATLQWQGAGWRAGARTALGQPGGRAARLAHRRAVRRQPAPEQHAEGQGQHPQPQPGPVRADRAGRLAAGRGRRLARQEPVQRQRERRLHLCLRHRRQHLRAAGPPFHGPGRRQQCAGAGAPTSASGSAMCWATSVPRPRRSRVPGT